MAVNKPQAVQYRALGTLNVYDGPDLKQLATQMAPGRYFCYEKATQIRLVEDDYPGWLDRRDQTQTQVAAEPYRPVVLTECQIRVRLPQVIEFALAAMACPNCYLWGGTVGPDYDCSGLMQAAFQSAGIWLPRDAYQQETFCQPVALAELRLGDLVFFGSAPQRASHVGLVLGEGRYIHSSGRSQGRNGIGIDRLCDAAEDAVSCRYWAQVRSGGRVTRSYCPGQPIGPDNLSGFVHLERLRQPLDLDPSDDL